MAINEFAEVIRAQFSGLLVHRGFVIAEELYHPEHMGWASTCLESPHTGILAVCERGVVSFSVGPMAAPQREWYALPIILAALHPETPVPPVPSAPTGWDYRAILEAQVRHWGRLLDQYGEPLLAGDWSKKRQIAATQRKIVAQARQLLTVKP